MIDFSKKLNGRTTPKPIEPKQIYEELDRQSAAGPLRPVQSKILSKWYKDHYDDKDVIIKLHTGEGKTLIGLLVLQSRLNDGKGPSLYVCPTKQLAKQVDEEATKFGIPHLFHESGEQLPIEFANGQKILITYVQRLFNGLTQFGLDNNHIVDIGTIVLDDSHACIDSIRSSFSVRAGRNSEIFKYFIDLFEPSMTRQGVGTYLDIRNTEFSKSIMLVPYWDWINKKEEVAKFMHEHKNNDELKFVYPLLKDIWEHCSAYFSSYSLEITPHYSLTNRFTAFSKAKQRIFMSATTQDDAFFIKGLGVSREAILSPLTDIESKWSGEKMIIFPTLIDESMNKDSMRTIICEYLPKKSQPIGSISIVVLVPSRYISDEYKKRGARVAIDDRLADEINHLKMGPYSYTVVFVNRYDGIDLADDQCRILVLDSLPSMANLPDKYEQLCRENSVIVKTKIAQKIEQGLGRSVRSEKDFSIVLIIGEDIVRFLRIADNQRFFSLQTRKQIEIGEDVTKMVKDEAGFENPEVSFIKLINQSMQRDVNWKQYYQQRMNEIKQTTDEHPLINLIEEEAEAEHAYANKEYGRAERIYQSIADRCTNNNLEKGWYLQLVARCRYHNSKMDAEKIQNGAHKCNSYVLMPEDVQYKKATINQTSIEITKSFIKQYDDYYSFKLKMNEVLSNLEFGVDSNKFESALQDIGMLLGFISERPDKTYRTGPDNLWIFPNERHHLVFECKNEVRLARTTISKTEVGQMNNHIGWFKEYYGEDANVKYIHIHPAKKFARDANYTQDVFVLSKEGLEKLRSNISSFVKEFENYVLQSLEDSFISEALKKHHLTLNDIEQCYAVKAVCED